MNERPTQSDHTTKCPPHAISGPVRQDTLYGWCILDSQW
jgi:hypothetical protein